MLHILLMVLKIIGIVLASVLILLLVLLLALLFVPLRYQMTVKKEETPLEGFGRITWLFHVLAVHLFYQNSEFKYIIKIFGIPLEQIQAFAKKIASLFKKKKRASEKKRIEGSFGQSNSDETNLLKQSNSDEMNSLVQSNSEESNLITTIKDFIHAANEKFKNIPKKILEVFKKVTTTVHSLYEKIKYWVTFLQQKDTQNTLHLIKNEGLLLIKHILPRKIKGDVLFGFDDPSKTGQTLGLICMFYPLYYKSVNISSDFTQKKFECNLNVKGRIYICILVKSVIKIYFDKDFQSVKSKMKKN